MSFQIIPQKTYLYKIYHCLLKIMNMGYSLSHVQMCYMDGKQH